MSAQSLAELVGGKPEYWKPTGPVSWGYRDEGSTTTFRHPGGDAILTYWAGFPEPRNANGCSIIIHQSEYVPEYQTRYVKCPSGSHPEFESDIVGINLKDNTGFFP